MKIIKKHESQLLALILLIIFLSGCKKDPSEINSGGNSGFDESNLVIFPVPDGVPESKDYKIKVNGKDIFCFATYRLDNINATSNYYGRPVSPSSFAQFDFTGTVNIEITPRNGLIKNIGELVVRPIALNIIPKWDGQKLTIKLEKPEDFTIDVRGDGMNPLHFFTNPPETDIPDSKDPNVIYFGPGIHDVDQIILRSNQMLYLAGGAFLRPVSPKVPGSDMIVLGQSFVRGEQLILSEFTENVVIKGRGIISAARATEQHLKAGTIFISNSGNLLIKDVILIDANEWNIHIYNSNYPIIDYVRVLGYYVNADAICFNSCRNGVAKNCFVHTADDSYEVKATVPGKVSENILFENCVAWNDYASCMGVTHEVEGTINGATWQNMTITRFNPVVGTNWLLHRAAIFVHAQGGGMVSNLTFKDITIEMTDTKQSVISVNNIKKTVPGINNYPDKPYNMIQDILFSNIIGTNISTPKINLYDEPREGRIKDITFENIVFNGLIFDSGI